MKDVFETIGIVTCVGIAMLGLGAAWFWLVDFIYKVKDYRKDGTLLEQVAKQKTLINALKEEISVLTEQLKNKQPYR